MRRFQVTEIYFTHMLYFCPCLSLSRSLFADTHALTHTGVQMHSYSCSTILSHTDTDSHMNTFLLLALKEAKTRQREREREGFCVLCALGQNIYQGIPSDTNKDIGFKSAINCVPDSFLSLCTEGRTIQPNVTTVLTHELSGSGNAYLLAHTYVQARPQADTHTHRHIDRCDTRQEPLHIPLFIHICMHFM